MVTGLSISGLILVIFVYFIFRKPIKTTVEVVNEELPSVIGAAASAASASAVVAAELHERELMEELAEAGIDASIEDLKVKYGSKRNRRSKQ